MTSFYKAFLEMLFPNFLSLFLSPHFPSLSFQSVTFSLYLSLPPSYNFSVFPLSFLLSLSLSFPHSLFISFFLSFYLFLSLCLFPHPALPFPILSPFTSPLGLSHLHLPRLALPLGTLTPPLPRSLPPLPSSFLSFPTLPLFPLLYPPLTLAVCFFLYFLPFSLSLSLSRSLPLSFHFLTSLFGYSLASSSSPSP